MVPCDVDEEDDDCCGFVNDFVVDLEEEDNEPKALARRAPSTCGDRMSAEGDVCSCAIRMPVPLPVSDCRRTCCMTLLP